MKTKYLLAAVCLLAAVLTGCKNDSEDDIPGWDNPDQPSTPANPSTPTEDNGKVVINEVCGLQDPDDDWIELYNTSATEKDLSGASIEKTDETGKTKTIFTFPDNYKITGKGFAVIATLSGELQAGISNKKEIVLELKDKDGNSLDKFDRDANVGQDRSHNLGESYARVPNGTGTWTITTATRGTENN